MSQKIAQETFRSVFKVVDKDALRWFPGHMGRGLKQMQTKLRQIDCIIEVHDARIPLSGRNEDFKYVISGVKPHILVLNKVDLIDKRYPNRIVNKLENDYEHIVFTNSKDQSCKGIRRLLPLAQRIISKSDRFNRNGSEDFNMMVIGVPNVGKSSVINALRVKNLNKGKASPVGATPGITRSVLNRIKISEKPPFYLLDTPGILTPNIPNTEIGLKLALCATIQDHLVGETIIADYLLFWLNKHEYFDYVEIFGLKEASDDILTVLAQISMKLGKKLRIKDTNNDYVLRPDLDSAAKYMLQVFRTGKLGRVVLDEELL